MTKDLKFVWAPEGVKGNIDVFFAFLDGEHGSIGRAGDPAPDEEPDMSTYVRFDDAEKWERFGNDKTGCKISISKIVGQ